MVIAASNPRALCLRSRPCGVVAREARSPERSSDRTNALNDLRAQQLVLVGCVLVSGSWSGFLVPPRPVTASVAAMPRRSRAANFLGPNAARRRRPGCGQHQHAHIGAGATRLIAD